MVNGAPGTTILGLRTANGARNTTILSLRTVNGARGTTILGLRTVNGAWGTTILGLRTMNGDLDMTILSLRTVNGGFDTIHGFWSTPRRGCGHDFLRPNAARMSGRSVGARPMQRFVIATTPSGRWR